MSGSRPTRAEPLRDLGRIEALRAAPWTTSDVRLRAGVVDRLMVAQTLVPRALRLLVVTGHRPPAQAGACPHATGHATGGAVDLTAFLDGSPVPANWCTAPPPEWPAVAEALRSVGMVNGSRWWHWSFGDAAWCAHNGGSEPLYGAVD